MKTLIFLSFAGMLTAVSAQKQAFNHWSVDGGFGVNKPVNPYTPGSVSNTICFPAVSLGARYSINNYFGLRADLGYGSFKNDEFRRQDNSDFFKTTYLRATLEGVANMGQVLDLYTIHKNLGLLIHGGIGISSLSNDSLKLGHDKGSDEMISFTLGMTPQFRVSERIAINADFSAVGHLFQNRTFDMRTRVSDPGLDGFVLTGTVGISFYLGKQNSHIDWYNETAGILEAVNEKQSRYDSIVSNRKDDDKDGVPNYLDQEPATAEGARVSVKGITIPDDPAVVVPDDDHETIDGFVEFPDKPGLFFTVQIGCYENEVDLEKLYGLNSYKVKTKLGKIRYLHGIYHDLADAERAKDVAFERGVLDTFVAAYYQGKRITISQAEKLLIAHGKIILQPEE